MSDVERYVGRVRDWLGPVAFREELVKHLRDQDKRIAELEDALEAAKNHTVMHWRTKDMLRNK